MLNINIEHPDYVRSKPIWHKYRDLYAGGEQLREHAAEYLVRRSKEPNEVYYERLSRVFYENYIGSIIDWYAEHSCAGNRSLPTMAQTKLEAVLRGVFRKL